jgi:hypothetical protein
VRTPLQDAIRKQFWSGDIDSRHFGQRLYRQIPKDETLRLKSFHYASLGAMELAGYLGALLLAARVAKAWVAVGGDFLNLRTKIEKFFDKRRALRKPKREVQLDDDMVVGSDEARSLVFDVGARLGFDPVSCEKLIEIVGNPISALKFLVAVGNEGRKLATLQENGLSSFPPRQGTLSCCRAEPTEKAESAAAASSSGRGRGKRSPIRDRVRPLCPGAEAPNLVTSIA